MSSSGRAGPAELIVTGLGIISPIGEGTAAFAEALWRGAHAFGVLQRPGRQRGSQFIGAELPAVSPPEGMAARTLRAASFAGQVALATLHQAWTEARLAEVDPSRIGLIIGGSNLQQRELLHVHEGFGGKPEYVRPTYGLSFMDSDLCGLCTEAFGIRGLAFTVGGASASGNLAVLQSIQALRAGEVDVCIALGAMMDLSYLELHALRALGALGSERFAAEPARACRPFDRDRDGFIYGESCAALVIELASGPSRPGVRPYGEISGWAMAMDANRNPNPSLEGEVRVIRQALARAGVAPGDVDSVNTHGSGSRIGDEIELRAILECGLTNASLNATKSLTGHGLSAAGAVELVATLLEMRASRLHPTRNLEHPLEPECHWVSEHAIERSIENALSLSFGFGGVNTAICLKRYDGHRPMERS
jgi:malonyl-ACP decarboxylase